MSDFGNKVARFAGSVKLGAIKHSPEILLGAGIVAGIATVVFACKGTLRANEVLEKHQAEMDDIHEAVEVADEGEYPEIAVKRDTLVAYLHTVGRFARLYAPALICGAISVTCVLASHGILRKRNVALAASLAGVRTAFDEYRSRVVRDLGKEMDRHFMYDTKEKVIEHTEEDPETGKTKKVKEKIQTPTVASLYSRFFDESNPNWEKDGASNYIFIRSQLIYLQNKLIHEGYLFLNDIYKAFGFPCTVAGQSAGIIYDFNDRENTMLYIDGFDMAEINDSAEVRAFKNGYERTCLLNFINIKDNILDDLPRIDPEFAMV